MSTSPNTAARDMSVNAAIRTLALVGMTLAILWLTHHMLGEATSGDPWGARLSPLAIMITGAITATLSAVTAVITASGVLLASRVASGEHTFVKYGLGGPIAAALGEWTLSGIMALFGLLGVGALLDASSGRVNPIVLLVTLIMFPASLALLSMRRVTILSASRRALLVSPVCSPFFARTIPFASVARLELALGSVLYAYRRREGGGTEGEPIELGMLRDGAPESERLAYAREVAAACGLPIEGAGAATSPAYSRPAPLPLP